MHQIPQAPLVCHETIACGEGLSITVAEDESIVDCNYWRTALPAKDRPFIWVGLLKAHLFLPRDIANAITRMEGTTFRLSKPNEDGARELYLDRGHRFVLVGAQHAGTEPDSMFRILETHRRNADGVRETLSLGILKRA